MPFYTLRCKKCQNEYEVFSTMSKMDKDIKKAKCSECGSKSKDKVINNCTFAFSNPVGSDRYNNSHDYRFHHQIERPGGARDQRKTAEATSHMGSAPYNEIDDISSGKYFGEVK